ncbi:MAG: zinc ABC transporter ATP-binding protein ZnuC [Aquificaceae bacterium]|nr:MAG: zinc ABC transporter ATP-binding protein ZnuC [Aquificaceae bacterium]
MQTSSKVLATLKHVNLSLGSREILRDISLEIYAGKVLTVIGPNGAGKSTLLRVLLGLQAVDSGEVSRIANLRIGYVPQKITINPLMPLSVRGFVALAGGENIDAVLDDVGVLHLAGQAVQSISGGEFQRVLLARALMRKPQLLVLDEPAQGVDMMGQGELYEKIAQLKDEHGFAVFMVSHDLHLVMQKTDQVLCLNQHICCSGLPEDVSQHPAYQRLFGNFPDSGLAVYTHHHDHQHNLHGDVVKPCTTHGCNDKESCGHG